MNDDLTFDDDSAFGSIDWAATRLGMTKDTFFRKRGHLQKHGFPKPNPILKKYLKSDIEDWIRRQSNAYIGTTPQTKGIDFAKL